MFNLAPGLMIYGRVVPLELKKKIFCVKKMEL